MENLGVNDRPIIKWVLIVTAYVGVSLINVAHDRETLLKTALSGSKNEENYFTIRVAVILKTLVHRFKYKLL